MPLDLFSGIPVADYPAALAWYGKLFGTPPSFHPNDGEAVWELAEHRYAYIEDRPAHAGHARLLLFVDDLDARVAAVAGRGIEPSEVETYDNGVRKVVFRDADGNEVGFGGAAPTG